MAEGRSFVGYTHLNNTRSVRPHVLEWLRGVSDTKWALVEKIHGSNFTISVDLETGVITLGSRTQFLGTLDANPGFSKCMNLFTRGDGFKDGCLALARSAAATVGPMCRVDICGELFGGLYTAPGVPRDSKSSKVQAGIEYHPSTQFLVFDIRVFPEDGRSHFLPYSEVVRLCAENGVVRCVPVAHLVDSYEEAVAISPTFQSTIAESLFGLPAVPDNFAEGFIVRPFNKELYTPPPICDRVIYKHKSPKFEEVAQPKPTKAEESKDGGVRESKDAFEGAQAYINENRLASVRSKGQTFESVAEEVEALVKDAMESWIEDHPEPPMTPEQTKALRKVISGAANRLVRTSRPKD